MNLLFSINYISQIQKTLVACSTGKKLMSLKVFILFFVYDP